MRSESSSQAGALQGCLANLSGPGPTWAPCPHLAITGGDQWLHLPACSPVPMEIWADEVPPDTRIQSRQEEAEICLAGQVSPPPPRLCTGLKACVPPLHERGHPRLHGPDAVRRAGAAVGSGGGDRAAQPRGCSRAKGHRGLEPPCGQQVAPGSLEAWEGERRDKGSGWCFETVRSDCQRPEGPGWKRWSLGNELHVVERNSRPLKSRLTRVGQLDVQAKEVQHPGRVSRQGGRPAGGATRAGRAGERSGFGER